MGKYVDFYCSNDNKELKKLVNPIITKNYGWIPQKDYDDIYSNLSLVVWDCEKRFNPDKVKNKQFESFLKSCIENKMVSYVIYSNRNKRVAKDKDGNIIKDVSMDSFIGEDESTTIEDTISDEATIEKEIFNGEEGFSEKTLLYLSKISNNSKKILNLMVKGFKSFEIINLLHISKKEYEDCLSEIRSYRNTSVLL